LLITALVLSSRAGENKTESQKCGKGFYIALCGIVFFLNGMVSIFSKVHQIETTAPKASTQGFIVLANLANLFLSSSILSVHMLGGRNSAGTPVPWKAKFKIILGITLISAAIGGGSYMLQLIGAARLPATVLYPMITGGSLVFTAIAAWAAFGEKLSFYTILSIFLAMAGTLMFL
jgi:multidrug transporter EmrE-like cation transporter